MYPMVPRIVPGVVIDVCVDTPPRSVGTGPSGSFARPKSRIFDPAVGRDEQVLGFEITMHDAFLVRRRETVRHLNGVSTALRTDSGPPLSCSRSVCPSRSSETTYRSPS